MAVPNGRTEGAMLNGRAGWPRRAGRPIGGIVTLAIMPDRRDISGDPGPVRVSPAPGRPPGRTGSAPGPDLPHTALPRGMLSTRAANVCLGAAHAMGNESNGE